MGPLLQNYKLIPDFQPTGNPVIDGFCMEKRMTETGNELFFGGYVFDIGNFKKLIRSSKEKGSS